MATQSQPGGQEEAERAVRDYQMVQEQMRAAAMQLNQFESQKAELEKARGEVSSASGKVYVTMGGVIVETTKEKALGDKLTQMYKQSQGSH